MKPFLLSLNIFTVHHSDLIVKQAALQSLSLIKSPDFFKFLSRPNITCLDVFHTAFGLLIKIEMILLKTNCLTWERQAWYQQWKLWCLLDVKSQKNFSQVNIHNASMHKSCVEFWRDEDIQYK